MAVLVILWYQLFLKKKLFEKKFLQFGNFFLAQKLSFLVRINILKFENRSSKNERILLAPFIFSLLAVVLRRYSSRSFADWPSGGYLLPKSSRAPDFIPVGHHIFHWIFGVKWLLDFLQGVSDSTMTVFFQIFSTENALFKAA